ncbi:hypothetical protein BH24ACT21_BH24ACT21_10530 [soil metagenome]
MGLAVIAMIIVAVVLLIGIPVLMRVFGEAVNRNEDRPGGSEEGEHEDGQGRRSGPRR